MNDQIDIGRVLDRWLGDETSTMPERVAIVVADRIDHQKQRRTWRLPWRLLDMNPLLKTGVALALLLNHVVDGLRARILDCWCCKPQPKRGPQCRILTPD